MNKAYSFCFCYLQFFLSGEPKLKQEPGLGDRKLVQPPFPPSNFIAGRLKAALLFWFFYGFRCGVLLCFVILVRCKNKKR